MLEQGPDFWCWLDTTQFSYHSVHPIHANMFSIKMLTFQSNCAEGLHFSAFHFNCSSIILQSTILLFPLPPPLPPHPQILSHLPGHWSLSLIVEFSILTKLIILYNHHGNLVWSSNDLLFAILHVCACMNNFIYVIHRAGVCALTIRYKYYVVGMTYLCRN